MYDNLTLSSLSSNSSDFMADLEAYIQRVNSILKIIQAFIVLFGLLGNLLALIVINSRSLKSTSSAVFITYLAIFDSLVLLSHSANLVQWVQHPIFQCSLQYFTDLSTFCSNWILVIITIERCIAVHSPFFARRFCNVSSARRSIYILLTSSFIVFSIKFPFIYEVENVLRNQTCCVRKAATLIVRIYQPLLCYAIPGLLLLSNFFTIDALCQRTQRFTENSINSGSNIDTRISDVNYSRKQRQLTVMLVTVSLSFYLFTTPAMLSYISESFEVKYKNLAKAKRKFLFSQLSVILLQLNNATNFIFYCFAGQRFRQATLNTLNHYSVHLKTFYHRYILGNREYHCIPSNDSRSNQLLNVGSVDHVRSSCNYSGSQTRSTSAI